MSRRRSILSLLLASFALAMLVVPAPAQGGPRARVSTPAPQTPTFLQYVLCGVVFGPAGSPAAGAVVVSSAGGQAVTGPDGSYRLEIDASLHAASVDVTATGGGGSHLSATTNVGLSAAPGILIVAPLELAPTSACQPRWMPTFGCVPGTDDTVRVAAVFDDGSGPALYAGGYFRQAGGVPADHIAKWDGRNWSSVGGGTYLDGKEEGSVSALSVFDDGSGPALYVGGGFTRAGDVDTRGIARWDGSSWSSVGGGVAGGVSAFLEFDDGSGPALYVGGGFQNAGGVRVNHIARWNGTSWSKLAGGVTGHVYALAVFDDGSGPALYAAGIFPGASHNISRWNGSIWTFVGGGVTGGVNWGDIRDLAVFDDGSGPALYAGGLFTVAGGVPAPGIARWDGASWSGVGDGVGGYVYSLRVFDDGGPALYAGGDFMSAGGVAVNHLARWDGASWSPLGSELDDAVWDLVEVDRGRGAELLATGSFEKAGGRPVNRVASWNGARWSPLGSGPDDWVMALAVHDDGNGPALYAGGGFRHVDGKPANHIARWDGERWSALGSGIDEYDSSVGALTVFDDGGGPALYAGGGFSSAGGAPANRVAKWDGSDWSPLGDGVLGESVYCLAGFDDGNGPALYAGGRFSGAGGVTASHIARWDGSTWSDVGGGIEAPVWAMAVFDDGAGPALYAAGEFMVAGNVAANRIARWDGASWSAVGNGMNGPIHCLAEFDDGDGPALYAGGPFVTAWTLGGIAFHVARWDGTSWSRLGTGMDDSVESLVAFDDGAGPALFAGGGFSSAGGAFARGIARWNGSSWTGLGGGTYGSVTALAVFDDGNGPALVAGGSFRSAPDSGDSHLARWGCAKARRR